MITFLMIGIFGKKMLKFSLLLVFGCLLPVAQCFSQDTTATRRHDSTLVFGTMEPSTTLDLPESVFQNSLGVDIMISTNGFAAGMFFRHEYSDETSAFIDLSLSESKDEDEKEFIDIYGRSFTPGKINRFLLLPVFLGIQKRVFKDDILDNFRPYVTGAVGTTMIFVFPYNEEYFSALGKGQPKYTVGGYLGAGAYFGSERSSLLGINLRYYFIPYFNGIESMQNVRKKQFGGFYISLSLGSAW